MFEQVAGTVQAAREIADALRLPPAVGGGLAQLTPLGAVLLDRDLQLQELQGGWMPSQDIAFALLAVDSDTGQEVRASPTKFDHEAIQRSIPSDLLAADGGRITPVDAMKLWTTLLCVAFMEKEHLDYVMDRGGELSLDGENMVVEADTMKERAENFITKNRALA